MAVAFKIVLEDGDGNTSAFDFDQKKVIVGRDPSADLVIDDIEISRQHLVVTREKDGFYAEDKQSTNGSFIGGNQIKKKTAIEDGDSIVLGQDHTLTLEIAEPQLADAEEIEETAQEPFSTEESPQESPEESTAESPAQQLESDAVEMPATLTESSKAKEPRKTETRTAKNQRPKWVIILLAVLAFIVVFCIIPLIVIEVTNQWCDLFAGFFNSMSPGVCP